MVLYICKVRGVKIALPSLSVAAGRDFLFKVYYIYVYSVAVDCKIRPSAGRLFLQALSALFC
nr:MAG TPA: hypothetical protein [Caudoviricetes sp.]